MSAIHQKLLRDLWQIKGQVLAIGLVMACGIAMFIMYFSTFESLRRTQEAYYERYRFADVFASVKRAPRWLEGRIAEIPGVARVDTRVVAGVTLDIPDLDEPATGRLISRPARRPGDGRRPVLNDIAILRGRDLEPGRADEVVVSEGFALARDLGPGDSVAAILNGRRRELEIVGVALTPEYVYAIRPGDLIADEARFGIFWMERKALATAFDMEGGFNDVSLQLMPGAGSAAEAEVIDRLDRLLEPYGALGAIPRRLQTSHWYLDNELTQLEGGGRIVPTIFLLVAAFLLNVVLIRIVAVQREQIAALKALGYSNLEVGLHYTLWSLTIAAVGGLVGTAGGAWLGANLIRLYNDYFRFPFLDYRLTLDVVLGAIAICLVAALLGAASAVRRAVSLPPAEAMRPEPPTSFRQSWVERAGLGELFAAPTRMILRNLQRRPVRTLTSVVGVSFAGAVMVVGMFFIDAIAELMFVQFHVAQRQDVTVTFVEPTSAAALYEIGRLPGVLSSEPLRAVPVRLVNGQRSRQTAITGLPDGAKLQRVIDVSMRPVRLPADGLVLSEKLAEVLAVERGDRLRLEVLEGTRPVRQVVVTDLVDEYLGTSVYMEVGALRRLLREGRNLSGASLAVDDARSAELYRRLKALPVVAGVAVKAAAIETFDQQMEQSFGVMTFFNILFASIIAFGVVYNAARISLSERSRELASLRVLGFTRAEISFILLGELAVVTLLAIPLGFLLGYGLAALTVGANDTELYRFPLIVSSRTYGSSALVVLVAAAVSGLIVRRRLDHLDLVEVLKMKE